MMSSEFIIKNAQGITLIGDIFEQSKEHVVIMSHGFLSHRNCGGFFPKVAETLAGENISVIKFDFAGCGDSENTDLTVAGQIEDLRAMITYAKEKGYKKISLFGHSLGGLVTFKAAKLIDDIHSIVVTAPVTFKNRYEWKDRYSPAQLLEMKETGKLLFGHKAPNRKEVSVSQTLFNERESVVQSELLNSITIPTLIIHGDEDERVPIGDSKLAIEFLEENSKLDIIEGASHSFKGFNEAVCEKTLDWFKR